MRVFCLINKIEATDKEFKSEFAKSFGGFGCQCFMQIAAYSPHPFLRCFLPCVYIPGGSDGSC